MATYPAVFNPSIRVGERQTPLAFGDVRTPDPVLLRVEDGSLFDFTTGVLGQGIGRIWGTVKLEGDPENTPLRRKVWLLRAQDGKKIRETWSDSATGFYEFNYVDETIPWLVLSMDHTGDKRAVVADGLVADLIA